MVRQINGANVLFIPNKYSNIVHIRYDIKLGAINENKKEDYGLAHMLEHMYFKGTSTLTAQQIAYQAIKLGTEFNAYTSRTQTCLYMTTLRDTFEECLQLIDNCFQDAVITPELLDVERNIILNERRLYNEQAWSFLYGQSICDYLGNEKGHPIIGTLNSIQNATVERLKIFKASTYASTNNLLITIVGDLSKRQIKRAFRCNDIQYDFLCGAEFGLDHPHPVIDTYSEPLIIIRPKLNQAYCLTITDSIQRTPTSLPQLLAISLLSWVLGSGMASILYQELREKRGLCYDVMADHTHNVYYSYFDTAISTQTQDIMKATALMDYFVHQTLETGITCEQFEMFRRDFLCSLVMGAETSQGLASINASETLFGYSNYYQTLCDFFAKRVTIQDIHDVSYILLKNLDHCKHNFLVNSDTVAFQLQAKYGGKVVYEDSLYKKEAENNV